MTSGYGPRGAPIAGASTFHKGQDGYGGPNRAPERVRILSYGYAGGWGNRIVALGLDTGYKHGLAHNAPGGLLVRVGSTYAEGTPLGVQGMTGTATGVHVHWDVIDGNGNYIDPEVWLRAYGGGVAGGVGTPIIATGRRKKMLLTHSTDGSGWIVTEDGFAGLPNPQVYNLFYRLINSNQLVTPFSADVKKHVGGATQGLPMQFNRAEIDIMNKHLRILALGVNTQQIIDPKKLASALSDALGKTITAELPPVLLEKLNAIEQGVAGVTLNPEDFEVEASVSAEELSAAFDAAIPRVAAALIRKQGEALTAASGV